ncbi:hypothetical protein HDV05_002065 [Chytridiales sp. JEL 0842]|nr:hypothetical protein HDV05_002065 [Chytridiales sp. JEL 0842]
MQSEGVVVPPSDAKPLQRSLTGDTFKAFKATPGGIDPLESLAKQGTWNSIKHIIRHEGPISLWRGLSPTLVLQVPSTVVYYLGYEVLKEKFSSDGEVRVYAPLLAGMISRSVAATIISPIELIRTRMQSTGGPSTVSSAVGQLAGIVRTSGLHSMWRGLGSTLWRDVPFSGVYWVGYELIKSEILQSAQRRGKSSEAWQEFGSSFAAGAMSGAFAAILTNPFDVAKTIQQVVKHDEQGSPHRDLRMMAVMRSVVKTEGWQGLFRGLSPRIAKVAPACAIMISSYELGKHLFTLIPK